MLTEFVYENRFYITGKVAEVRRRLLEHAKTYNTVKELVDDLAP